MLPVDYESERASIEAKYLNWKFERIFEAIRSFLDRELIAFYVS